MRFPAMTPGLPGERIQSRYPNGMTTDLSNVAVVIPALNEEQSLPHVLRALPAVGATLVVDNGSTDTTAQIAKQLGASVLFEPLRGYGNACKTGIAEAHRRGLSIVVILDADHSFNPMQIADLVAPIQAHQADMVLGDRTLDAEKGALLPQQRFGNWVAVRLIHRVVGYRYRDMGPFRAVRTRALVDMEMADPNFGWNVEMQIKAVQRNLRVMEIPVTCRPRKAGQSKISGSMIASIRCGAKMIWATWHHSR